MPAWAIGDMNKDLFYKQINHPSSLSSGDIEPLTDLVEQYPYFASARVLLAKALHAANDHRFDDALQKAAIFAGNRKMLYDLIMRENLTRAIRDVDLAIESEEDPEIPSENYSGRLDLQIEAVKPDFTEVEVVEDSDVEETEASRTEVLVDETGEKQVISEKLEDDELATEQEETRSESRKKEYDELEREILFEAINSSISMEVEEDARQNRISLSGRELDQDTSFDHAESTEAEEKDEQSIGQPNSYSEWIRLRARQIEYYKQVEKGSSDITSQSNDAARQIVDDIDSAAQTEERKSPLGQEDLIEKFIQEEPKITPRKADMFSSENLAKMSIVEDETFVTETMAKIFARQGNIRKARKAYKLLSLKYPEKSIYFANQIKKLEGKK